MVNNNTKTMLESVVLSNKSVANEILQGVAFVTHCPRFLSVAAKVSLEKCSLNSKIMPF